MTYSKSAWVLVSCFVLTVSNLFAQKVSGHVYIAESETPCSYAIIQAWPCGTTFSADSHGAFHAECETALDSLTVVFHGYSTVLVNVNGRSHLDVAMHPLSVTLNSITINAPVSNTTIIIEPKEDLIQTLNHTPGIRSLDLGAGVVQPVIRGLMGSRVVVLDGGIPQVGGRWGQDHGILIDTELYDGIELEQGGGQIWLGPDAVGGGIKFLPIKLLSNEGSVTRLGASFRGGDDKTKSYILHKSRNQSLQWHCGFSYSKYGDRNVPQTSFEYIGRLYQIDTGRLPNTSGTSNHFVAGFIDNQEDGSQLSIDFRFSEIHQGLFPGIIGIPTQNQLQGDGDIYSTDIPNQRARRTQLSGKWLKEKKLKRTIKFAFSNNLRIESAPPHAHGYGPEPENDLSLYLSENYLFSEFKWDGYHGSYGIQYEYLQGSTDGWEFLLPNHNRTRLSTLLEYKFLKSTLSARFDFINIGNEAYTENLYNSNNEIIGEDIRAYELNTTMPSWAIRWDKSIRSDRRFFGLTTTAYTRAPSNYALAANGIHHGTFRFEQGNPDLKPETAFEIRSSIKLSNFTNHLSLHVNSFASLHKGFIHLKPTASFAPIAHGGQIYAFQATDAFRTGFEIDVNLQRGKSLFKTNSSILGQWSLETGLGLPFTPPLNLFNSYSYSIRDNLSLTFSHRAIAPSFILARNEDFTEGVSLLGCELKLNSDKEGTFHFKIDNILNRSWLDHISAYRALGLVTQGRWWLLSWSKDLKNN